MAFDWRGTPNDIRYGDTTDYGNTVIASTPDPLPFSSAGPFWEAQLVGLAPGATYHYSIGGGSDHTFHSPPAGSFRFDVIGDISDSTSSSRMAPTQTQVAADDPAFVLATGDLTYGNSHGQAAVDQHFNDVMAWSQIAAYMPAWGNHEWDDPTFDDLRNYKGRFAIPGAQTSPGAPLAGCCGEDWGWFDAGGVRFISYPEPYAGAWADWQTRAGALMAGAQADPTISFIVTYGHRPAYSTGYHPGKATLAAILDGFGDAYSKYAVNFNGHSHDYERFQPIHGVLHITAAGGGAGLESPWTSVDPRTAFRAMHLEHVRVDVSPTSLHIEAVCGPPSSRDDMTCTQGSVIDSVTIGSREVDSPPGAALSVSPTTGQAPLDVTADASASRDDDLTPIQSYAFDWGDGTDPSGPQAASTATHSYPAPGTFTVTMTVTDSGGLSSTATAPVTATALPPPDAPPVAALNVTPTSGQAPLTVTADASGSSDGDVTPIQSYSFDFGDGTVLPPQAEARAQHVYDAIGTYPLTVTVTDTAGLASTATAQVTATDLVDLVGNPGFEAGTAGWKPGGSKVTLARTAGGHSGDWAAQLTNTGTSSVTCTLNDSPNWVGQTSEGTYRGSLWARSDQTGRTLKLRFREYAGSTLVRAKTASVPLTATWQQASVTYVPSSPGSTLDFTALASSMAPGSCFSVDDASITRT